MCGAGYQCKLIRRLKTTPKQLNMWRVRWTRRWPKAGYICLNFFMFSEEERQLSLKVTLLRKTKCRTEGRVGGKGPIYGGSHRHCNCCCCQSNQISQVWHHIEDLMYVRGWEGGLHSRQCCNCCCSCCSNQISQVRHLWRRPRAGGGRGARGREQRGVMWCKVNRPTKVHMLRFSGTVF